MPALPLHVTGPTVVIGDVHGRSDLLGVALNHFHDHTVVLLGDLIDRGPASREVLELVTRHAARGRLHTLLGNHEALMIDALVRGHDHRRWLRAGGTATIRSYHGHTKTMLRDAQWLDAHARPWIAVDRILVTHAERLSTPDEKTPNLPWLWRHLTSSQLPRLGRWYTASMHGHTPLATAPLCVPSPTGNAYYLDSGAYSSGILTAMTNTFEAFRITLHGVRTAGIRVLDDPVPTPAKETHDRRILRPALPKPSPH